MVSLGGKGDDVHREGVPLTKIHGQGDPVHRDGALLDDETAQGAGHFEGEPDMRRARPARLNHPDAVHVAGDQVPAQAVSQPEGSF